MRTDAQRNRERLLEAAATIFRERGLDVGVGEIAEAAGVGRATLFRNFASKDDLIAAIVLEQMEGAIEAGRALIESDGDEAELAFTFIADVVGRQTANRALLEGVGEQLSGSPEVSSAYAEILRILDALLDRGKKAGAIRPEVVPEDVMMLVKGICLTTGPAAGDGTEVLLRHLDLVRAAITTPAYSRPLRGAPVPRENLPRGLASGPAR